MIRIINKQISLVFISMLTTPIIVAATCVTNAVFTLNELIFEVMLTWQFPFFSGLFWVGMPLYIRWKLHIIKNKIEAKEFRKIGVLAYNLKITYFTSGILYGLMAGVITMTLGYPTEITILAIIIAIFYLGIVNMPFYLRFVELFDTLLKDVNMGAIGNTSLRSKLRITSMGSAICGVGILIVSVYVLIWRLLNFPELELTFQEVMFRLIGLSIFIAFVQILPNFLLGKALLENIQGIENFVSAMSHKDLTKKIEISSKDEFGVLAEQLNNMCNNYNLVISQIGDNSEYLKQSSGFLSEISKVFTEASNHQAVNAQELAANMEQMIANIESTGKNATNSEKLNELSKNFVSQGKESLELTIENIQTISQKIKEIAEIAAQTDLLAINAYIEAANGKEHGKGFSAVAREVKVLAEKSKMSSSSITQLANTCLGSSKELNIKFSRVEEQVIENLEIASNIALATVEQQTGSEQINDSIQNLNNSAQDLAESSSKLWSSSKELSDKANSLRLTVDEFTI